MKVRIRGPIAFCIPALLLAVLSAAVGLARAETPTLPTQGQPPPDFSLHDAAGKTVRLSDFKGRVILLTFWSCFTDTCYSSVGAIDTLLGHTPTSDLVAPTICSEIPPALAENGYAGLLARCSVGQKILVDPGATVAERYQVRGYPTTLLIGRDFTIRELLVGLGPLRDPALIERVNALVHEKGGPTPP